MAPLAAWMARHDEGIAANVHGIDVRFVIDDGELQIFAVKAGEVWLSATDSLAGDLLSKLEADLAAEVREEARAAAEWWEAA